MPDPPPLVFQFRIEEYKSLRAEIDTRIKESFNLVIYCITAIAAVYGSLITASLAGHYTRPDPIVVTGLLISACFPVFGLVKSLETASMTMQIAAYLRGLEADLGVHGWENKVQADRNQQWNSASGKITTLLIAPPYWIFWIILFSLTVLVLAAYVHWRLGVVWQVLSAAA